MKYHINEVQKRHVKLAIDVEVVSRISDFILPWSEPRLLDMNLEMTLDFPIQEKIHFNS